MPAAMFEYVRGDIDIETEGELDNYLVPGVSQELRGTDGERHTRGEGGEGLKGRGLNSFS